MSTSILKFAAGNRHATWLRSRRHPGSSRVRTHSIAATPPPSSPIIRTGCVCQWKMDAVQFRKVVLVTECRHFLLAATINQVNDSAPSRFAAVTTSIAVLPAPMQAIRRPTVTCANGRTFVGSINSIAPTTPSRSSPGTPSAPRFAEANADKDRVEIFFELRESDVAADCRSSAEIRRRGRERVPLREANRWRGVCKRRCRTCSGRRASSLRSKMVTR